MRPAADDDRRRSTCACAAAVPAPRVRPGPAAGAGPAVRHRARRLRAAAQRRAGRRRRAGAGLDRVPPPAAVPDLRRHRAAARGRQRARRDRRRRLVVRLRRLRRRAARRRTTATRPAFLAQLVVDFADGSRQVVATDAGWTERPGAIRAADLLMGEYVDARAHVPGWDAPGAAPTGFRPVAVLDTEPGPLVAEPDHPVRVTRDLPRRSACTGAAPGRFIVDFGQNLVGRVRLTVRGRRRPGSGSSCGTPRCSTERRAVRGQPAPRRGHRRLRRRRRADRGVRAAVHLPRLPVRRGRRLPRRAGRGRRGRPGAAQRHAVDRQLRVLRPDGQPAAVQHHLGAARQLRRGADRLPAARRAARLAGRRADLRPDREPQRRRLRVLRPLAARRRRRAGRRRRVPRRRPGRRRCTGRRRRPGATPG